MSHINIKGVNKVAVDEKVKFAEKTNPKNIGRLFSGFKAEIKRITWPNKKDIKKAAIAVGVFCLIYVLYVGILDAVFKNLFDLIFRIK
jgi:preprotein translocase subunit SecE